VNSHEFATSFGSMYLTVEGPRRLTAIIIFVQEWAFQHASGLSEGAVTVICFP
jgi:hypothetical protein